MYQKIILGLAYIVMISLILVTAVSADELELVLDSAPQNVSHDAGSLTISFDLINTNESFSAEDLEFSATSNKGGTWDLPFVSRIANLTTETLSAKFSFQPHQSGRINMDVKVNGTINGILHESSLKADVFILPEPSLIILDVGELSRAQNSTSFKLRNTGNTDLSGSIGVLPLEYATGKEIDFVLNQTEFDLSPGEEAGFIVSAEIPSDLKLGDYLTKINVTTSGGEVSESSDLKIVRSYCDYGRVGSDLEIEWVKDKTPGGDDWDWKPLDEVDIKVKVFNHADNDEDVTIKLDLYDTDERSFVDIDNNEETIEVNEHDSRTYTFTIDIPSDVDEKHYRLYVKAYVDGDEEEQCTDLIEGNLYQDTRINKESRDVILSKIDVPSSVECGSSLEISARAYNIGSNDEDEVKVNVWNKKLGIDEDSSSFALDEGESRRVLFSFDIPENVSEDSYDFSFIVYFDYDDNDEEYDEESEVYKKSVKVDCKEPVLRQDAAIFAELVSEAKEEGEIIIKATITNTGETETLYFISVEGVEGWASVDRIEPSSFSLDKQKSRDVNIYLTANKGSAGEHEFVIRAVYGDRVTEQRLQLAVERERGAGITGAAIGESFRENWFIWLIVIVNVILIILIIVIAARLAR